MGSSGFVVGSFAVLALASSVMAAGTTTDSVMSYVPGQIYSASLQTDGTQAIGLPDASEFGSDTTAFSPPFSKLAIVGNGGQITLHFAQPVVNGPGADVGVYTNVGLAANFDPTSGAITATTSLFSTIPQEAIVSVSTDDQTFVTLNGGLPLNLSAPTTAFTDSQISYDTDFNFVNAEGGTTLSNFYQPSSLTVADYAGTTYAQQLQLLNGAAGGTWIDIGGTGLSQVNYIRFTVASSDYRLVLAGVTAANAVPEPASLGFMVVGMVALMRRRQR